MEELLKKGLALPTQNRKIDCSLGEIKSNEKTWCISGGSVLNGEIFNEKQGRKNPVGKGF